MNLCISFVPKPDLSLLSVLQPWGKIKNKQKAHLDSIFKYATYPNLLTLECCFKRFFWGISCLKVT